MDKTITYQLRYMRLPDIPDVVSIDQQSFSIAWSAQSYVYEVTDANHTHMIVAEEIRYIPAKSRWEAFWRWLLQRDNMQHTLLAYGGLWHFGAETHISTIASHPAHRGQGWGELVLVGMLRRSVLLDASHVVLEVRVSNVTAQNLYRKYHFVVQGTKARYYHDNNEDAYDMILTLTDKNAAFIEQEYHALCARFDLLDTYTDYPRPT